MWQPVRALQLLYKETAKMCCICEFLLYHLLYILATGVQLWNILYRWSSLNKNNKNLFFTPTLPFSVIASSLYRRFNVKN